MKILLIRPPATSFKKEPSLIMSEPLGLLYLAAYLKKHGKTVGVIDGFLGCEMARDGDFYTRGISDEELRRSIKEFSPDIVGINCMFTQFSKGAHDVARIVKDISKDTVTVLGGAHASSFYEGVLHDPNVDLVVRGEGEETLLEIVQRCEKKESPEDIRGTAARQNGAIKLNPPRPFKENLDDIPFPARDLLNMDRYYNDRYSINNSMKYPRLSIVTSRGCPFNCVFCSVHSVWRHTFRARSASSVIEEIQFLQSTYGAKEIIFWDDNLTFDKARINEICDAIVRNNIKIRWGTPNGVAIWTLDKPTIKNMKRAGCYKIAFGLESGSKDTLRFIHKDFIDVKKSTDLIRYCNKIGLWTIATFIIGFPYETKEDIYKTLFFAIACDVDMATIYNATPYPGTELFDIYKREGLLADLGENSQLEWLADIGYSASDTKYLTKEEINLLRTELTKKFLRTRIRSFLNPARLLRKLKGLDEIRYFLKMARGRWATIIAAYKK